MGPTGQCMGLTPLRLKMEALAQTITECEGVQWILQACCKQVKRKEQAACLFAVN